MYRERTGIRAVPERKRRSSEASRLLVNLLSEDHSRAPDSRHHLILEGYGYRWFRLGGLDYLLKRSDVETSAPNRRASDGPVPEGRLASRPDCKEDRNETARTPSQESEGLSCFSARKRCRERIASGWSAGCVRPSISSIHSLPRFAGEVIRGAWRPPRRTGCASLFVWQLNGLGGFDRTRARRHSTAIDRGDRRAGPLRSFRLDESTRWHWQRRACSISLPSRPRCHVHPGLDDTYIIQDFSDDERNRRG